MNNDVLRLHERDATNFETGDILNNAVNISEQRKINDIACLQFEYPMDDKARLIKENMLLTTSGRIYEIVRITRKMDGRDIVLVVAKDMFSRRAQHTFLPNVPDMIGKKTSYVIKKALETATDFSLYTDAELSELGMKWVGDDEFLIDFFSADKITLWDFLQTVIENSGRGEIYSNGYKFALVERVGCDRGVRLTLDKNMQNIEIERSTEDIITKLYPFGAEDLTIKNAKLDDGRKYGKEYILSPNAEIYGIHEGCKDYSDYTEPEKVYANAMWEFDSDNEERIDIPKLTITGKLIDLSKLEEYGDIEKVELGDTVHVYDIDGQEYAQRIIEGTWYPYEARETVISIGHMRRDVFFTLYQLRQKKRELEAVQTTNKQITTRKIQGAVNTDRNNIQSENKQLLLNGDLLHIDDDNGRRRVEIGNVGGAFVFNLYDVNGSQVIHFNEKGDGTFSGTIRGAKIESDTDIQVTKDAAVGQYLRVGYITASVNADGTVSYEYQDESGILLGPGASIKADNKGDNITVNAMGRVELRATSVTKNNSEVVTQSDLNTLSEEIRSLKNRISVLENK